MRSTGEEPVGRPPVHGEVDGAAAVEEDGSAVPETGGSGVLIDCDNCTVRPRACSECVVSVLLGPPADAVLDGEVRGTVRVPASGRAVG